MTPSAAPQHTTDANSSPPVTHYRTATVDGLDIFYREAGPANGPAIVLLHGFPTSSHMFRNLIPLLADRYHVIAPDYPGFGLSAAPDHAAFDYGFGRYADLMENLLQKLGVQRYAMYVMDYGAPVGYRLALKLPERVTAIVVQNGNAYEEGLKAFCRRDPGRKARCKLHWNTLLERQRLLVPDVSNDPSNNVPITHFYSWTLPPDCRRGGRKRIWSCSPPR